MFVIPTVQKVTSSGAIQQDRKHDHLNSQTYSRLHRAFYKILKVSGTQSWKCTMMCSCVLPTHSLFFRNNLWQWLIDYSTISKMLCIIYSQQDLYSAPHTAHGSGIVPKQSKLAWKIITSTITSILNRTKLQRKEHEGS